MQMRFAANLGEEFLIAATLRQTSFALFKWLLEVSANMLRRCSGELLANFFSKQMNNS